MGSNVSKTPAVPLSETVRNAAALSAALDSIILLDQQGLILEWNPAAESVFGYPRATAIGREVLDLIIPPPLRANCRQKLAKGLGGYDDGLIGQRMEITAVRANGEQFIAELAVTRLPGIDPPVFSAFLRDISRRINAEKALRESEQRFALFMTHLPSPAFIKDGEGRIIFVNDAHKKIMGWQDEDWRGKTSSQLFPSDVAARFEANDRLVRETLQPLQAVEQIPHLDGNHQYLASKFPILLGAGEKPMVGGIAIEFTDLHRAEEAVRYQKVLLESVNNASHDGLLVVSPQGNWLSFNGRFLEMWGIDQNLIGKVPDDEVVLTVLNKIKNSQQFLDRVRYLYQNPHEQAFDERIELVDGRVFSRSSSPVVDSDGKFYGRVWFFHDRSAEELAQHRLLGLASELTFSEERERRRIARILHDGVVQLLGLSQMKLRAIDSASPAGAAIAPAIQMIDEALAQTRQLTVELSPAILHERGLVPAIEWLTKRTAARSGIDISFSDDGHLKPLAEQVSIVLFQAVQELLTDMTKHSKATRGEVKVSRRDQELRLIVQDNGIGFDTSALRRRQEENDCFGLYSIQERLRFLGGALLWESEVNAGAKFTITAPLQKSPV